VVVAFRLFQCLELVFELAILITKKKKKAKPNHSSHPVEVLILLLKKAGCNLRARRFPHS